MGRPRRQHQAEEAAKAASDAARVLQQRQQEVRSETVRTEPPEDWTPPKRNDTHSRSLEEIAASREAMRKAEEPVEEPKPEPKAEPQVEPKAEPEAKAEPKVEPEKTEPEKPAEPEKVRVKVDGEEEEVLKSVVDEHGGVRAYQIQRAAENRLKKTNEVLAEIRKAQAEILAAHQAAQKPKEPEVTEDQFIASKMDAIRFGTPEEASRAWLEIQKRQSKPVDTNAIIEQATNRFMHDQAVREFDKEFQDIVVNPLLLKLVVSLRNERIPQQRGPVDWQKFYRDIGNEVRGVVGKPTSSPASTTSGTPSQQSDKETRKAEAAVTLPAGSSRAELPKEEKPETREDMLRNLRKSRGLPV